MMDLPRVRDIANCSDPITLGMGNGGQSISDTTKRRLAPALLLQGTGSVESTALAATATRQRAIRQLTELADPAVDPIIQRLAAQPAFVDLHAPLQLGAFVAGAGAGGDYTA